MWAPRHYNSFNSQLYHSFPIHDNGELSREVSSFLEDAVSRTCTLSQNIVLGILSGLSGHPRLSITFPLCHISSWRPVRFVHPGTYRTYSKKCLGKTWVRDTLLSVSFQTFPFQFPGCKVFPIKSLTLIIFPMHKPNVGENSIDDAIQQRIGFVPGVSFQQS